MTNQNTPKPGNSENQRNVTNPKAPGEVERVNPATGGTAGTVDTGNVKK